MNQNPCRKWSRIDDDKNTAACKDCQKRLNYIYDLERASGGSGSGNSDLACFQLPFPLSMSI